MKATLIALTALLGCLSCATPATTTVRTIQLPEEGSPFIAFNIWVQAGSQDDPAGKEGLASLTAQLLAESGTTEDSYEQILAKLYPLAASYDSSVDKEMTVFTGEVHKDNLEAFYALLRNALLSPGFREADFDRVKAERLNFVQRTRRFSSDEELGKELLSWEIFKGTPYAHPEEGYVHSVDKLTLDDVRAFYRSHYARNRIVIGIGGGYPADFPARVEADFAKLPESEAAAPAKPVPQKIQGMHVLIVEKNTKATAISFGYPIAALRSDEDFYPLMLANSWLGEHRNSSSHLYQVIRETRGMNYGDYSYIEAYPMGHRRSMPPTNVSRRQQIFQIWIRPISMQTEGDMHDRALFATRAALRELKRLVDQGMTQDEFDVSKSFLWNYTVNYGATLGQRLGYRVDDAFYGIPAPGYLAKIRPELQAMTREDVNQSVRKYLEDQNLWLVFITQDAEGLKQKLVSGEETPISYPTKKPDSVLEEDKLIQSFPLPLKAEDVEIVKIGDVFE
ncbi:MAG: pitrilysin family protein [Acidobacteriota bacterium]